MKEAPKRKDFYSRLARQPMLMLRLTTSLLYIGLAFAIFFVPAFGFSGSTKILIATMLLVYGCFRLYTFYADFNRIEDE